MIVEMQLSASKFLGIFREGMKKALLPVCDLQKIPVGSMIFDRVALQQSKLEVNPDHDNGVVIVQQTQWSYVKESTLLSTKNGAAPVPDKLLSVDLVFDIKLVAQPSTSFVISFVEARTKDPDAGLIPIVMKIALSKPFSSPVDVLSGIEGLMGGPLQVQQVGVAADTALTRVAIRFDVGSKSIDSVAWADFFGGTVPDRLQGRDWAILLDKALVVSSVVSRLQEVVAKLGGFSLDSGPSGSWAGAGATRVDVNFAGEVIDACQCFWGKIDLDVNVDLAVDFLVPKTDSLQMAVKLDLDKDFLESLCCSITTAALWPVMGTALLASGKLNFGLYVLGFLPPVAAIMTAIQIGNAGVPLNNLPPDCQKTSDESFTCTQPFTFKSPQLGELHLVQAAGASEGLVLAGSLVLAEAAPPISKVTGLQAFSWQFESCKTSVAYWKSAFAVLTEDPTLLPLEVCSVELRDDPKGYFHAKVKKNGSSKYSVEVSSLTLAPADGVPYPAKLILRTNGGVHFISIPSAAPLSADEVDAMSVKKTILCKSMQLAWIEPMYKLKHPWPEPDPPFREHLHLIDALVSGLTPGDAVSIRRNAQPLGQAQADARGVAHLRAAIPYNTHEELLVQRDGRGRDAGPGARSTRSRQFDLTQTLIEIGANLDLAGGALSVLVGHYMNHPAAFVLTDKSLAVLDISAPALTRTVAAFSLAASGMVYFFDHYVVWGASGAWSLSSAGGLGRLMDLEGLAIRDAAVARDKLVLLTDGSVDVYERDHEWRRRVDPIQGEPRGEVSTLALRLSNRFPVRNGQRVAASADTVVVGDRRRLLLFDLSRSSKAPRSVVHGLEGLSKLTWERGVVPSVAVNVETIDGTSVVIDVSAKKTASKTRVLSRSTHPPWHSNARRLGSTIVMLDEGSLRVGDIVGVVALGTLRPEDWDTVPE